MPISLMLYRILVYVALPFAFLRLGWRGRDNIAYRQRWSERLGFFNAPKKTGGIWIHGVSLGEIVMATPLIRALIAQANGAPVTITTMTITGSQRVQQLFGDQVFHVYLPYDTPDAVKRFLDKVQPSVTLILETEIWPNFYVALKKRNIPLYIINARISPTAMRRYKLITQLMKTALDQVTFIAAQSEQDLQRFLELGANPDKVKRLGNLKFDITIPEKAKEQGKLLRQQIGEQRKVWIAASTHEGEEDVILALHKKILETVPNALLILVPRHPERFEKVAQLIKDQNFILARRSEHQTITEVTNVYLGDTMGEMLTLYATSDVAVVCGSIKPIGGQNSLEPAALSVPPIVGPYTGNCEEITEQLKSAGGLLQYSDNQLIGDAVEKLLTDKTQRDTMGQAAQRVVAENAGVLQRVLKLVGY